MEQSTGRLSDVPYNMDDHKNYIINRYNDFKKILDGIVHNK